MVYESVDVKENEILIKENEYLRNKINKAIDYIEECTSSPDEFERFISTGECKKLLKILKGEDNDA